MLALIPYDQKREAKLREKMAKDPVFDSPEKFITIYNAGYLVANNDTIKNMASEIEETFKNVISNRNSLVVLTETELAIDTIFSLLEQWRVISSLKRIATTLMEEGYSAEDYLYFREDKAGYALVRHADDEYRQHWANTRKLASSHEDVVHNIYLNKVLKQLNEDGTLFGVPLYEISSFNDDFVLKLQDFIVQQAQN